MFLNIHISSLCIIIYISLLISISIEEDNLRYIYDITFPSVFTLLNQQLIMISNDGIHFYSSDLTEEDESKKIIFETEIQSESECEKIAMTQFPSNYGGFIIILVKDILYFFQNDGTKISSENLPEIYSSSHYCLIPYKKENNYLHYLISYPIDNSHFGLVYFQFDINSPYSNEVVEPKTLESLVQTSNGANFEFSGVNCVFMIHPLFDYDILVCFYGLYFPAEIQARSFDPNNNFEELNEYYKYYNLNIGEGFVFPYFIYAMTNEDKNKAYISFIDSKAYSISFDFENYFSEPLLLSNYNSYQRNYYYSKLYYFKQTNQYILASTIKVNCEVYVISLNSDFSKLNEGLINPDTSCYNLNSFSIIYNGDYYSVIVDEKEINKRIVIYQATDIGIIGPVEEYNNNNEPSLETTNIYKTILPTLKTTIQNIKTTSINIKTTIPTIKTTIPTIKTTLPTIKTTLPTVKTTFPTIKTTFPTVKTTFPTIKTTFTTIKTTFTTI